MRDGRDAPDSLNRREAVEQRHLHVHQDEIGAKRGRLLHRFEAVARHADLVTAAAQEVAHDGDVRLVVLGEQNRRDGSCFRGSRQPGEKAPQLGREIGELDRLGQVSRRSHRRSPGRVVDDRDHNDRDRARLRHAFQLGQDCPAGITLQQDVENDHTRLRFGNARNRVRAGVVQDLRQSQGM